MPRVFRFTVKSSDNVNEQDFLIKLKQCGLVTDGMLFVESASIKNAENLSNGQTADMLLYGGPFSQLCICSTSLSRPDSYDTRTDRETRVLKSIPLNA